MVLDSSAVLAVLLDEPGWESSSKLDFMTVVECFSRTTWRRYGRGRHVAAVYVGNDFIHTDLAD
jgi:uncharacterized protein with PIN domain